MNFADYSILFVIVVLAGFALRYVYKHRKKGCCSSCSGCAGCTGCDKANKK